jgi:adenine-specific DNA-methyltransferase
VAEPAHLGDKKYVLPALLDEFAGQVNLIYIDPPFDTGADFSFTATVPSAPEDDGDDSGVSFEKQPSVLEQKAYRDTWGRGLDSYLQWFYETAVFLHELLHSNGSIYVHVDWHVAHYVKVILDEVFGLENFRNEIVWKRSDAKGDATQGSQHYGRIQDTIFFYSKSETITWNPQYLPLSEEYVKAFTSIRTVTAGCTSSKTCSGRAAQPRGIPFTK